MKSLSLRYRILLPIIAMIVLGMGVNAILSARATTNIVETIIIDQLQTLTQNLSTQVSSWIQDLRADLKTQSEGESYRDCLMNQGLGSEFYVEQTNKKLKEFTERYGIYDSILLLNEEGKAIASSDPNLVGKLDLHDRDYFKDAMQGQETISTTVKSRATGNPIFTLGEPIKLFGKVGGVLLAAIEMSKFSDEFILPIKIGTEGYAYMTDKTGVVSAHPDPNSILKLNLNEIDWGKKILSKKNGIMNYSHNGIEKIAIFRTEPSTGWVIITGAATDDIFNPINGLIRNNAIVGLIVVLVLTAVIIFIVRPIINALNKGVSFAREIQRGDLSGRLYLTRSDEIGHLAGALDSMADSLQQRAELAETIAEGDLSQEVVLASEQDVLGLALRNMTDKLNEIISQVNAASEQIDSGAGQVSDSAQDLSQGATQQASAIEEIGASLGELAGRTQENANNAVTANQLANTARDAAYGGSQQMQQMVTAMQEINESGQNIGKIIKTIDEIAFQTNLLALNAAVEAARAGQHGKGFAVVAEEVRNLAARSAKAARETAELIEGSVQKGQNGTEIANRTAAALEEIVNGIGKTADLVGEIAASSKEQAEGINQVSDGISQIDQVTQRNTAGAEEGAAAAEELSSQSAYMRQLLAQFHLKGSKTNKVTTLSLPPAAKPKAPVQKKVASKQASLPAMAKASNSGWDDMEKSSKPVIALDDDEFGKY